MQDFIPYGRQYIDDDDIEEVAKVLRSDFLTCGPYIEKFEKSLCDVTGAAHAVACNSGTAALHLAMLALDIKEGDKVIVPTVTFLASANAARYCGAAIVFADVDVRSGLLTLETLREAYDRAGGEVKAVVVVHLSGQLADMKSIKAFCDEKNIKIIEDACHALGGKGVGACKYSDMAAFSFHPVKTIAMGEGGAVTTQNAAYGEKMRVLRSHGIERGDHWKYSMNELGYNYRVPDLACALGLSQLKKLDQFVARRNELAKTYNAFFKGIDWAEPVLELSDDEAYHLYPVLINFDKIGKSREEFMDELRAKNIGTQVHYIPVHTQPYYGGRLEDLPRAAEFYSKVLSLPLYYSLTEEQQNYVMKVLSDY